MAFTVQELDNIAQAVLDWHKTQPEVVKQTLQDRPLLDKLVSAQKTFPAGKDNITVRVKGEYTTTIQGFEHDDTVTYANPANLKTATYPYKLLHWGIQYSKHELIKAGIEITDDVSGKTVSRHSGREKAVLVDLLKDKVEDMMEGSARDKNRMFWQNGSQDPKEVPGVTSFILDNPASATVVAGIDQATNVWWRNRANVAINSADPDDQAIVTTLQGEFRQLRRYGGRPNLILAGSDFLEAYEAELRAKGTYTLNGWTSGKVMDGSMADSSFKGVSIIYDPTLDDMSKAKYCYVLDTRHIFPMVVEGEDNQDHNPARPENKYVYYKAQTWVGGLVCDQRNCHGVYAIS